MELPRLWQKQLRDVAEQFVCEYVTFELLIRCKVKIGLEFRDTGYVNNVWYLKP